jgi:glycosyltransferase involved in cell wall biosynthesis
MKNNELGLPEDACILHLSPFPPGAKWGGAIRSEEIFKVIKEIFPSSQILHLPEITSYENPDTPDWVKNDHPQLSDILMLFKDYRSEEHLDNVPDAVIFDHPWLWSEAKKLKEIFPKTKLIHSSHNIEFLLKSDLLKELNQNDKTNAIKYLREVEEEIAKECDLILCVTELDKLWFQNNGAANVIASNNGTTTTPQRVSSTNKYALVIGSGHPPNVEGSIKYLYDAATWMPNNSMLVYLGDIGEPLRGNVGKEISLINSTEVLFLGVKSNEELEKLISSASVILLPIPYGGGSNLKTAEALASGRPIVGTTKSFRSFQPFANSRNVVVTDDVDEFREACFNFTSEKLPTVYRYGHEKLLWSHTLLPFKRYLSNK